MKYRIHPINPQPGFWSFHTPKLLYPKLPVRSLFQNALVSGIDTMLSEMKETHGDFDIIMSDEEIQCDNWSRVLMTWERGDRNDPAKGGNWYKNEIGQIGWLCPVLFDYFNPCPEHIFVYVVKPENSVLFKKSLRQWIEVLLAKLAKRKYAELIPLDE
jgi:hypothetical protein